MNAIDQAIQLLTQARRGGPPPAAVALPDAAAAYAVQAGVAQALGWFADGPPGHWKSGGPSGPAPLTHAPLPPAGVWASPAAPQGWPFRLPHVEAEVALRLSKPVDAALAATLDTAGAHDLVEAMAVSIELVDFRWAEAQQAPAWAKLADLQSHGALVLGPWQRYDTEHHWAAQVCRVKIGDAPERQFVGTHSLGQPAAVLPQWLRHATRQGAVVPAGTVVTTGTWCGLLPTRVGDRVQVWFDGIGEAGVQL